MKPRCSFRVWDYGGCARPGGYNSTSAVRVRILRSRAMRHARWIVAGCFTIAAALAFGTPPAHAAERVTLDKPARLPSGVQKVDKTRLAGRVTAFDDAGFELADAKGATQTIAWDDLAPQVAFELRQTLIA